MNNAIIGQISDKNSVALPVKSATAAVGRAINVVQFFVNAGSPVEIPQAFASAQVLNWLPETQELQEPQDQLGKHSTTSMLTDETKLESF
jgi:hypothetical protein